jgi:AcrR family transcriptional regulator
MTARRLTSIERKEQIAHVAASLFAKRGFYGVTTREIADAAGVSEAMVFRHFPTKDKLYAEIIRQKMRIHPEDVDFAAVEGDDEKFFRAVAGFFLQQIRRDSTFLRLMLYSALSDHKLASVYLRSHESAIFDILLDYIKRRVREGAFRPLKPIAIVNAFVGMYFHSIMSWKLFRTPKKFRISEEDAFKQFVDIFLDGVRA